MGKSGGASRQGASKPVMRVSERRATTKTAKTPEQAHAEKIARAEESVRKAQQAVDDAMRRSAEAWRLADTNSERAISHELQTRAFAASEREIKPRNDLKRAQTRLANLRAANPSQTPAQRAHAAKSAQYEAKIAKARDALAKLEAEYAAHQRGAGEAVAAAGPARGNSTPANRTRQQAPAGVSLIPRADSLLRAHLTDVTDPRAAWTTFGASRQRLYDTLKDESAGVLESMARRSGGRPPRLLTSNNDVSRAINRDRLARFISDQMAREFGS